MQISALPNERRPPALAGGLAVLACLGLIALYAKLLLARWQAPQALDDFAVFWVAGRLALAGHAASAYDWTGLNRLLDAGFGAPAYARGFYYPPMMFLLVAPFGLLPFATAAAVWLATTTAAYAAAIGAIVRHRLWLLVALAAPVLMFNFATGQNGLLLAGLIGGALVLLDTQPAASGVLIGLLACKPHFGLLLPFYLAVTGRWRVFASATATVLVLVAATALLIGVDSFPAFLRALPAAADGYVQRQGLKQVIAWGDLESVYGILRTFGLGGPAAWVGHIAVGLSAIAATMALFWRGAPPALQMAALATAMMLLTPYSELNDVAILMVPWAFLVRDFLSRGWRGWEMAGLASLFLLPLLYLPGRGLVKLFGWPGSWAGMGPLMCAIVAALIVGRLRQSCSEGADAQFSLGGGGIGCPQSLDS